MRVEQTISNGFSIKLLIKSLSICFLLLLALQTFAEEVPAEERAIIEKAIMSKVEITKPEMGEDELKVFRAPTYNVKPILGYIAIVDGELLNLSYPGTNTILSGYLKLIRDDFVLDSKEKADILANAFHPAFPYKLSKIIRPKKIDNRWIIVRGDFFKKYSGLVFTTDAKGKITLVEFVLSIDPKDFSYEAPEIIQK